MLKNVVMSLLSILITKILIKSMMTDENKTDKKIDDDDDLLFLISDPSIHPSIPDCQMFIFFSNKQACLSKIVETNKQTNKKYSAGALNFNHSLMCICHTFFHTSSINPLHLFARNVM